MTCCQSNMINTPQPSHTGDTAREQKGTRHIPDEPGDGGGVRLPHQSATHGKLMSAAATLSDTQQLTADHLLPIEAFEKATGT